MTFREGPIDDVILRPLKTYNDPRGWLVELFRNDELPPVYRPVMAYISETLPGVVRGPHEHYEQADYFAFIGPGDFRLTLWDARPKSATFGNKVVVVVGESNRYVAIVPPGVVHAYQNISDHSGWVFNCPNALYAGEGRKQKVDEIRHETDPNSPYHLD